jgi:hypothetical protein
MPILSAHLDLHIDAGHQNRDNSSLGYNSSSSSEALVARDNLDDAVKALYVKLASLARTFHGLSLSTLWELHPLGK